ncbi:AI-2E family transporter [Ruania albidiflava]|uniref:AI-2E family transporter n=1 Tax=Ruania albidiflava TaxID=366586 RepID=UPI0003B616F9|nr:AI-2E family transporter [Ruania albidiflava]
MRRDESAPDEGHGSGRARPEQPEAGPDEAVRSDGATAAGQERTGPAGGAGTDADDVTLSAAAALAAEQQGDEDGELIAVVESDQQRSPVTPAVRGMAAWSWRFLVIVLAAAVAIVGLIQIKTVVVPILVAALLTALLVPVVNWLQRHRIPRAAGAGLTMLGSIILLSGLLTLAGASIGSGIKDLADTAWQGFQELLSWLSTGPLQLSQDDIDTYVQQIQQQLESNAETIAAGALSVGTSVGHVFAGSLITLFCLFFFLKDGSLIWHWLVGLFPLTARNRVDVAGQKAWTSLGSYARTQVMVAFIDGLGIGVGAWLLGVPLALPLGVLVFVGSFIPIVGAVVTGSVAVAVALVDQGVWIAVAMLGVVLLVQQAESHLLQPLLMSRALKLHPVAVLLAVATGTIVGGIVGALFAVPVIAVANTVLHYLNGGRDPHREVPRLIQRVRARRT